MAAEWGLPDVVDRLSPITLEEVLASAELQTRVDRKYVVSRDVFSAVLAQVHDRMSVLEIAQRRAFRYESVYFDTPDLTAYRQHAHGRRKRVKVRTRAYLDTDDCLLEFKRVGARGETVKERYPYSLEDRYRLDRAARALAGDRVGDVISAPLLEPVLTTTYLRMTLVDSGHGCRVTCDLDLRFEDRRGHAYGPAHDLVVLESKTTGALSPFDRVLVAGGRRPVSLSKYCVGMAVLDPSLPANRWNRELRRWFGWTPAHAWDGPRAVSQVPAVPQGPPAVR
jgi:hypothetical protein